MTNIRTNCDCVTAIKQPQKKVALDTLAQLDILPLNDRNSKALQTLEKRAFAKYYTMKLLYPLIDLKNTREKSYWNTYHCVNILEQNPDGKITSKYCKNRWCIVCNKIRTGILHNTHKKSLQAIETRFVTLTTELTKTCVTKEDLSTALDLMKKGYAKAWRNTKKKYGKLRALRKTEVTWKDWRGTFHPHFHIILENNSDEAEYLVSQWLKQFPNAVETAQNISITDEKVFNETFKYLCKMWSTKKDKLTNEHNIVLPYPPQKMDNIFEVFRGKRIIQTYNLKYVELDDFEEEHATIFTDEIRYYDTLWFWEQELKTWVDYDTGELRTKWKDFTKSEFNSE